ncbi:MAG TPA: general stress protein [Planococcus sp. (in: firmicutes)]|nr:general stress protein [Planococcus sp. (in: firmicutes)]
MEPTNRDFELVYSPEELRSRIEELKGRGYSESDIHVLVEDSDVLGAADNLNGVQTHNAGSVGSKFKSFFTGRDSVREELKNLDLEQREIDDYQRDLEKGAILLYTDRGSLSRERDNQSSFGDDTRVLDSDEVNRNAALEPFGKDVEKDGSEHSSEIYTTTVPREEQYGVPNYGDEHKDSRLKGENIHPTTDRRPTLDESSPSEKLMEHEPALGTQEGNDNLNREDGVNRRQDEQSPGVDPNLGPAPFGRDSEEEHLLSGENGDYEEPLNPDGTRRNHDGENRRPDTPPTPKLF